MSDNERPQRVRKFLSKMRDRASGVVTIERPDNQDIAEIVVDAIKLAAGQSISGAEKRTWAIKHAGEQLDDLFEGNPNHPFGRILELVYGPVATFVVGLMVETAYQAYKSSGSA